MGFKSKCYSVTIHKMTVQTSAYGIYPNKCCPQISGSSGTKKFETRSMMWYHFTNLSLHCVSRNVFRLEFDKAPHSSILSMDIFFICASQFFDSMSLQLYRPLLSFHLTYAQAPKALLDPSLKMINVSCSLAASFGFTHLLNLLFFIS